MFIGHNKMLLSKIDSGNLIYYSQCSQCKKTWKEKQLTRRTKFVKSIIKIRAQGQKITIKSKIPKQTSVNIYAI